MSALSPAGQQLGAFDEGSLWLAKIRFVGAVRKGLVLSVRETDDGRCPSRSDTVFSVVPASL
jgi:hypothetical protein